MSLSELVTDLSAQIHLSAQSSRDPQDDRGAMANVHLDTGLILNEVPGSLAVHVHSALKSTLRYPCAASC